MEHCHVFPINAQSKHFKVLSEPFVFDLLVATEELTGSKSPLASPYIDLDANDNQEFFANEYVGSSTHPLGKKKEKK